MNSTTPPSFSPRQSLSQVYRLWWVIVCLGILGGVIGWLIHKTLPRVYISSVEFAVTIDPEQTGILEEREYDSILLSFGRLFYAPDIIDKTLREAAGQGIQLDTNAFLEIANQEWRIATWTYSIRHPDPKVAQQLAMIWGETASEEIAIALVKAQEAQVIQNYIDALITCDDEAAAEALSIECVLPAYENVEQEIAALNAQREPLVQLSRSLIPAIGFEQTGTAELPVESATTGQATLVFFSTIIGLLAGVWLVNLNRFNHTAL